MVQTHEGKCVGFIVLLLCLTSTLARTLILKEQLPMMKLHQEGMLELEPDHNAKPYVHELDLGHEVIPKIDPVVVKLDNGQNFGSGPVTTNLGGGDYPDDHKSNKGTVNMMRQADASTLP
ncbi:hypothetical protein IGI04_022189 [Brassica rapa subsp. trilocularis]|uniref:Neprosin activation peptide domain-containing protein n=1 Tax=Brassica rapa subsp. trilocularis TaxID=1813537 RepID=A0ABQ7KKM2_BRACM|nr:hypothetical protein IGI04_042981 [Brassica rapa subsp. trilocularis]KAG5392226.1 hypothetical protein IGI04_022189 [Brassica rapa subsp. trilocularis]